MTCKLLALPRELRDDIWALVVSSYLDHLHTIRDGYKGRNEFHKLLVLNRQINQEIQDTFRNARIFNFTNALDILWCHQIHRGYCYGHHRAFKSLAMAGHISILPNRVNVDQTVGHPSRAVRWRSKALDESVRTSALFLGARSDGRWRGWHNVHTGLVEVLRLLTRSNGSLRSLELPAIMLLNIRVVRPLRRLRGVELRLAIVDDIEFVPGGLDTEGRRAEHIGLLKERKWLGQNGEVNFQLPVYESETSTVPFGFAPLSSLANAIRTEAAGMDKPFSNSGGMHRDCPLYLDFSTTKPSTTPDVDALLPTSGWYRYLAHDPGICCLEKATAPLPTVANERPPRRKALRRAQRERMKMRDATYSCACIGCRLNRVSETEEQRIKYLLANETMGCVLKGGARLKSGPWPTPNMRYGCRGHLTARGIT